MNIITTRRKVNTTGTALFFMIFLLFLIGGTIDNASGQELQGSGWVSSPERDRHFQWESDLQLQKFERPDRWFGKQKNEFPVLFHWPMEGLPQNDHVMHNYVDLSGEESLLDYNGGTHTYEGHTGTDLSIRNFREMDQGIPVFAAADGVVSISRGEFDDRNTEWNPDLGPLWNGVTIFHNDSTVSRYLHLRKNSIVVETDEEVEAGDFIGYIGSSGFSTNPHLHFDVIMVKDDDNGRFRDPWEGPANSESGMWGEQLPYLGNEQLAVYDTGIATRASMGGELQFIWHDFVERLSEPAVIGMNEPEIVFWINAQTLPGDSYHVELRRPDNSVYSGGNGAFSEKTRFGYWYFYWLFDEHVSESDFGEWTARILGADSEGDLNVILSETKFNVGEQTVWGPRFLPAGKSIRMNGEVQQDELQMSEFTGEVTFNLVNAPDFVNLNGNVVEFNAETTQPLRSTNFEVLATDQNGLTDTFYYHVVDPEKPRKATSISQSQQIGTEGGELSDETTGASVIIPNGALSSNTEIEIGRYNILPDGAETFGEMVYLGPSGLTFSEAVTVTVPYDPSEFPEGFTEDDLMLIRYSEEADEWTVLEHTIDTQSQTLSGTTTSFSGFAAGELVGVSVEEQLAGKPEQFSLDQNYPNPFNPSTVIHYTLPEASEVRLEVFNLLGQRVSLLVNENVLQGSHSVAFQAGNLSSGIYIYRIQAGGFTQTRKMLLVK